MVRSYVFWRHLNSFLLICILWNFWCHSAFLIERKTHETRIIHVVFHLHISTLSDNFDYYMRLHARLTCIYNKKKNIFFNNISDLQKCNSIFLWIVLLCIFLGRTMYYDDMQCLKYPWSRQLLYKGLLKLKVGSIVHTIIYGHEG